MRETVWMCVFTFGFWSWISCRSSLYCSTSWSWRLAWVSSSCRQKHTHTHTDNQRVLWSVSWSADEIDTLNIHRRLGSIQSKERNVFNPDSPSSAHPFYVLDDFIDVGLIDLNLLPGNTQSDRTLSLSYTVVLCSGLMSMCVCVCADRTLLPDVSLWSSLGWSSPFSFDPSASSAPFSPCSGRKTAGKLLEMFNLMSKQLVAGVFITSKFSDTKYHNEKTDTRSPLDWLKPSIWRI